MEPALLIVRIVTATLLTIAAVLVGSVAAVVLGIVLYLCVAWATARAIWEAWQ